MSRDEARFSLAAYAVITGADGAVLMTRRREGNEWVLPGGSVEVAETPWDAVAREVSEETGLQIDEPRLVGVVFLFRAAAAGGRLRESDERDRVVFIDPRHLPQDTSARDVERVKDALAEGEFPILSVQHSHHEEPPPGTR
jgi:8-oxo-dGTP pyrophosphatase MutT (NUDIX family)